MNPIELLKQTLPLKKINGNSYEFITHNHKAILVKLTTPTNSQSYEVWIKAYTKKDKTIKGTLIPQGSLIKPSNESFGRSAFSYYNIDSALKKLSILGGAEPLEPLSHQSGV